MGEHVGIRELRQNASEIVSAAEDGRTFHVTVRGKDTGVVIAKPGSQLPPEQRRRGATLTQIKQAAVHGQPAPPGYEAAMLDLVERGRDESGWVGAPNR